ncbi:MAG: DUF5675 family protein [Gammaproteobacteria bacterium]|nr:DUF5675 family protein [Gammaproteobacteria bacterium]
MIQKAINHYKLARFSSDTDSTLGLFFRNKQVNLQPGSTGALQFMCYTLEDEHRTVKVPGETRIPAGTYEILLQTAGKMAPRYAEKYDWHKYGMLCLQKVPNFTGIFIHPGETDKHTDGCILTGNWQRQNVTQAGMLKESVEAYKKLYLEIAPILARKERVTIEIVDLA